jgi:cytochrome oxidase assembly protein ShyY1
VGRYAERTGLQVQPVVVQQQNDLADGLLRSWERPDFGIATHYGYAVQWFSFCALIIFLYVFFLFSHFDVRITSGKCTDIDTLSEIKNILAY